MAKHYQAASLFCLPTHLEAFGISFIETMHHALPAVGTDLGAIPDFVIEDQTGYRVRVGDVDGLTRVLDGLLSAPEEMQRLGQNALKLARERYTWEKVGSRLGAHFREALAEAATSV